MDRTKKNQLTSFHLLSLIGLFVLLIGMRFIWIQYAPTEKSFLLGVQVVIALIALIHSFYGFILFLANREQTQAFLLSTFLFIGCFTVLLDDDRALLSVIDLTSEQAERLAFILYTFIGVFLVRFFRSISLQAREKFQMLVNIHLLVALVNSLLFLQLPAEALIIPSAILSILNLFATGFTVYMSFQIFFYEDRLGFLLVIASLCNIHNLSWGIVSNLIEGISFYPLDFLFTFTFFILFMALQFLKLSKENKQFSEELQLINEERSDFLIKISHELRNSIHGIVHITKSIMLSQHNQLTTETMKNLRLVASLSVLIEDTLNDLLERRTRPKETIQLFQRAIQVGHSIDQVLQATVFLANEKNIHVYSEFPDDMPEVWADSARLNQIFFNLIHFVSKHTEPHGTIRLNAHPKDSLVQFSITNTKTNLDDAELQALLHPKEKDAASDEAQSEHDLAMSRYLINLHGGTLVGLRDDKNEMTISFTLPIATKEHEKKQAALLQDKPDLEITRSEADIYLTEFSRRIQTENQARILLVNENPIEQKVLYDMLQHSYKITCAHNGKKALQLLQTEYWDLVIADNYLPNLDGYQLTQNIRQRFSLFQLPIILLTGEANPFNIKKGFISGANDYIQKPVSREELLARVTMLTTLKQAVETQSETEMAWLQAQIRPHFLFNTLNTIASLGHIDVDRMVRLLDEFGNYLQHSFHWSNTNQFVPLSQEISLLKSYLYIEKERFGERIQINYELDESIQIKIPPLSIQPLVENAVRHGILQKIEGGTITIRIQEQKGNYQVTIADDGVGMSQQKQDMLLDPRANDAHIGLLNTHRRLMQIYGKGLSIESKLHLGTKVSFTIPKEDA